MIIVYIVIHVNGKMRLKQTRQEATLYQFSIKEDIGAGNQESFQSNYKVNHSLRRGAQ
jgi:hypothetical protein